MGHLSAISRQPRICLPTSLGMDHEVVGLAGYIDPELAPTIVAEQISVTRYLTSRGTHIVNSSLFDFICAELLLAKSRLAVVVYHYSITRDLLVHHVLVLFTLTDLVQR